MHWYTLTPFNRQMFRDAAFQATGALSANQSWLTGSLLPLNGHSIVAALRDLLPNAIVTLRGPFFCRQNTLYFPSPLHIRTAQFLVPIAWLPTESAGETCIHRSRLWDRRKPAPLVALDRANHKLNRELHRELHPDPSPRPFLAYPEILRLMQPRLNNSQLPAQLSGQLSGDESESESAKQPWTIETRWGSPIDETGDGRQNPASVEPVIRLNPGWKIAIGLDDRTARKLNQLGDILLIDIGENRQPFWLEAQNEPFQQQWNTLQEQSAQNRRIAQQSLTQQPELAQQPDLTQQSDLTQQPQAARILAYLVTPGVFERKHSGVATCRNFPWEWDLAYPADRHQPRGPLASLATTAPVPIRYRCLSNAVSKEVLAVQVFAVSPGSVYYLEYPADLFQDQPLLQDGRPNKIHIWRQFGYSELLWMPYQNGGAAPDA